jgi:hypothetical protein
MFPVGYTPTLSATNYFVTDPELISYINQSYFELYDLLITCFEDYYVAPPTLFTTDGVTSQYPLPDGVISTFVNANTGLAYTAPKFYKLMGVDIGVSGTQNAFVTLHKFDFISRNRYVYPQLTSTYLGMFNLRYRLVGGTLMFIPTPSAGQYIKLWYYPVLTTLAALSDTADGISGWTEYIICDAAIKCMQKEESDCSMLMAQKAALIKRIEETAMNRDVGQADTISNTRTVTNRWGFDGGWAGY